MNWELILQWGFLISLLNAGIRLAVPILIAVLGEIITESSGVTNLGLEGIMSMGAVTGFMTAFYLESHMIVAEGSEVSTWIRVVGRLCGWHVDGVAYGVALGFSARRSDHQRDHAGGVWGWAFQLPLSPGVFDS